MSRFVFFLLYAIKMNKQIKTKLFCNMNKREGPKEQFESIGTEKVSITNNT